MGINNKSSLTYYYMNRLRIKISTLNVHYSVVLHKFNKIMNNKLFKIKLNYEIYNAQNFTDLKQNKIKIDQNKE